MRTRKDTYLLTSNHMNGSLKKHKEVICDILCDLRVSPFLLKMPQNRNSVVGAPSSSVYRRLSLTKLLSLQIANRISISD